MIYELANEADTLALGAAFSSSLKAPALVLLKGDLGTGKTTWVRGFLRGLDYSGKVKSPTYTLIEEYDLPICKIYHFDLYRLSDPEEIEYLGAHDYFKETAICFIEWPQRAASLLPPADLSLSLNIVANGRRAQLEALSESGGSALKQVAESIAFKRA